MKKLKWFILIIVLSPIIINAQTSEEVKYKYYTVIEEDVRYDAYPEYNCNDANEIYDKSRYIYPGFNLSLNEVEERESRLIYDYYTNVGLSSFRINGLELYSFGFPSVNLNLYEIEFIDSENNVLDYRIESNTAVSGYIENLYDRDLDTSVLVHETGRLTFLFNNYFDIRDVTMRIYYKEESESINGITMNTYINHAPSFSYDSSIQNYNNYCLNNECVFSSKVQDVYPSESKVWFNTKVYMYSDPLYMCYKSRKLYVPGYYAELPGFIRDEEDYIIETENDIDIINDNIEELNDVTSYVLLELSNLKSNNQNNYELLQDEFNKISSDMYQVYSQVIEKVTTLINSEISSVLEENKNIISEINNLKNDNDILNELINDIIISNASIYEYVTKINTSDATIDEIESYINNMQLYNDNIISKLDSINNNEELDIIKEDINNLYLNNNELIDSIKKDNNLLAFNNKEVSEEKSDNAFLFIVIFSSIALILSLLLVIISIKIRHAK